MRHLSNHTHPQTRTALSGSLTFKDLIVVSEQTHSIGVRCHSGQLQVVAVWRVIGPYAAHVRRVRVVAHRGAAYEEVGITFGTVTDRVLIDMTNSIASIPWVLDVWFCP